ncbi:MAG: OmpA family protein [Deltaproteobacteria bacterium]|jgi:OOP family OmpA-OmpF porin|nr:OmpA family protein [Deltaproteobacteria bacterium]
MKAKIAVLAFMVFILGGPGLASAQFHEDSFHLSVLGGMVIPNSGINLDNGPVGLIGLGYNFGRHWGVELMGTYGPSIDNDSGANHVYGGRNWQPDEGDADLTMARLSALYHFDLGSNFVPYVSLGVGGQLAKRDAYSDYNSVAGTAAVGFKYFFNEVVALRVEASDSYGFKKKHLLDAGNNRDKQRLNAPVIAAGLTFQFGGTGACADTDKDGVCDIYDKCPGTPAGYKVDADGCPITVSINLHINFDFDKSVIKPEYFTEVQKVADFLIAHPLSTTVVEGHTDSRGSDEYNERLSQRRADAVREALLSRFNIDPGRVTAVGYGESRPVADNDTAEGRALNRRVVGVVSGQDIDK